MDQISIYDYSYSNSVGPCQYMRTSVLWLLCYSVTVQVMLVHCEMFVIVVRLDSDNFWARGPYE